MFLAYLDDSGTRQKDKTKFQVLTAVLINDPAFFDIEREIGATIGGLLPPDRFEKFEEFHAWELYGGYGVFEGIDQHIRFAAIEKLLFLVRNYRLPVIYGAVNTKALADKPYASASPIDIAFRICAEGISAWIAENVASKIGNELAILIADDSDNKTKSALRQSFRQMRRQIRPPEHNPRLWYVLDDMYFGSSKDSVGIQLADLCAYFIAKHLEGDVAIDGFYQIIAQQISNSRVEPEEL
jgi:hypothetical protein